jgi:hypothetical protein
VLSSDKENILPFSMTPSKEDINNPELCFTKYLRQYLPINDEVEFLPQLIKLNHVPFNINETSIDCVYGFVVDLKNSSSDAYWIPFTFNENLTNFDIVLEAIQKLK